MHKIIFMTTKTQTTKLLKIATYLKTEKKASVKFLRKRFSKPNPMDTIMSLRRTYNWNIITKQLADGSFIYEVKKVGKMPTR